ncbi:MAG: hypothetical protein IKZ96_02345 [Bacilli bacterium]|nr:hypothetical protein [Bacilli bacterium]
MGRASKYFLDKEKKIPLRRYCLYNGLNYPNVIYTLRQIIDNKLEEYEKVSLAVKIEEEKMEGQLPPAIEDYIVNTCKNNNIDETIVRKYMARNKGKEIPINQLATEAVRYALDHKYFSGWIAVDDICEDMGYDKAKVNKNIDRKIAKHPDLSKKYIIDQCLSEYDILYGDRFMIDGKCVEEACKREHINPMYLVSQYRRKYKDLNNVDPKKLYELFKAIVSNKKPKFFEPTLDDMPLSYICEMHNYNRELIEAFMYEATITEPCLTDEEKIIRAVKKYEYVMENHVILEDFAFKGLKETDNISMKVYYTKLLNLDDKCVKSINAIGFDYYQTVALIWFFGNKVYEKSRKRFISDDLQRSIFSTITCLDAGVRSHRELDLNLAYRLYKCEVLKDNNRILASQISFYDKIIDKVSAKYGIPVGYDTSRCEHRVKCYELLKEAMDNCFSRNKDVFITYITNYVIEGYENYLKSFKKSLSKKNKNKNKKEQ